MSEPSAVRLSPSLPVHLLYYPFVSLVPTRPARNKFVDARPELSHPSRFHFRTFSSQHPCLLLNVISVPTKRDTPNLKDSDSPRLGFLNFTVVLRHISGCQPTISVVFLYFSHARQRGDENF